MWDMDGKKSLEDDDSILGMDYLDCSLPKIMSVMVLIDKQKCFVIMHKR